MATPISVSLDDDVLEKLNSRMDGYGANRSEWVEEAIKQRLEQDQTSS